MSVKDKTVLPFEEWKSRLLSRGLQCSQGGTHQISAWELDGDEEQWMFNEYTSFPHFGQVMAAAMDPANHKAETCSNYMFGYYDPTGNPVFGTCPKTGRETGKKPKEKFPGATMEVLYYDFVIWISDFDKACALAWEMYRRRRLPTAKDWEDILDGQEESE